MALSTFQEYLHRLDLRYLSVQRSEGRCSVSEPGNMLALQLDLIDKTEAFHQSVYSTLSAFLLLLTHVLDQKTVDRMPVRSIKKALDFLERELESETCATSVAQLRKSIEFRTKSIDHPQQHALRNWMTIKSGAETAVLYFVPDYSISRVGNEIRVREMVAERFVAGSSTSPWQAEFLPEDSDQFLLAPHVESTHLALKSLVDNAVGVWLSEVPEEQADDSWGRYVPATLHEVLFTHRDAVGDETSFSLTARQFPIWVRLGIGGENRPLEDAKRLLIQGWSGSIMHSESHASCFEREFRFFENEVAYWLPVQESIALALSELETGQEVVVYALWIGTVGIGDAREWVFLVNRWDETD